jgi:hypothetical protein
MTNAEECVIDNPRAGTWHVLIDGYEAYRGVMLLAVLTGGRSNVSGLVYRGAFSQGWRPRSHSVVDATIRYGISGANIVDEVARLTGSRSGASFSGTLTFQHVGES